MCVVYDRIIVKLLHYVHLAHGFTTFYYFDLHSNKLAEIFQWNSCSLSSMHVKHVRTRDSRQYTFREALQIYSIRENAPVARWDTMMAWNTCQSMHMASPCGLCCFTRSIHVEKLGENLVLGRSINGESVEHIKLHNFHCHWRHWANLITILSLKVGPIWTPKTLTVNSYGYTPLYLCQFSKDCKSQRKSCFTLFH